MYSGGYRWRSLAQPKRPSRALALNPDLSIAHNLYTPVELETGRARQAMLRLLKQPASAVGRPGALRRPRAGLPLRRPPASAIVAHEHACASSRRSRTAVCPRVPDCRASTSRRSRTTRMNRHCHHAGARSHGPARSRNCPRTPADGPGMPPLFRLFSELTIAYLEDRRQDARVAADEMLAKWSLRDPCGTFYFARAGGDGAPQRPADVQTRRRGGFPCYSFFAQDPWLDSLRDKTEFNVVSTGRGRLSRLRRGLRRRRW